MPGSAQIRDLTGGAVKVLVRLCELADVHGQIAKTQHEIGTTLERGETVISRSLAELEDRGLVFVDRQRSGNVYRLPHVSRGAGSVNPSSPARGSANGLRIARDHEESSVESDSGQPIPAAIERPIIRVM